jgi:hypothetical protein
VAVVQYAFTHKQYAEQHKNNRTTQITTALEECGPCPVFVSFTLAFALQLWKKHGKTSVRVRKTSVCNWYDLFTLSFLSKPTRHGRNVVSLYAAALNVYRASNVWVDVRNSSCLVHQLQPADTSPTVTSCFVWSWTIRFYVIEGLQDPESWTQYSSCVSALFTVYA